MIMRVQIYHLFTGGWLKDYGLVPPGLAGIMYRGFTNDNDAIHAAAGSKPEMEGE